MDTSTWLEIIGIDGVIAMVVSTLLLRFRETDQAKELGSLKEQLTERIAQAEAMYEGLKGRLETLQEMSKDGFNPTEVGVIRSELQKGLESIQSRIEGVQS